MNIYIRRNKLVIIYDLYALFHSYENFKINLQLEVEQFVFNSKIPIPKNIIMTHCFVHNGNIRNCVVRGSNKKNGRIFTEMVERYIMDAKNVLENCNNP